MDSYKTDLFLNKYNLQTHGKLKLLEYTDENEWLALRREGIGGSDVGAVMGLNDYRSALQVYKDKIGEDTEKVDNVYTRKGKDLEALIRNYYVVPEMARYGYKVVTVEQTLVNTDYPWLRANIDGLAIREDTDHESNIIIEIKWVSEWAMNKWDNDDYRGVPPSYYAQVQLYMLVTGAQKAIICALFDKTWEVKYYQIRRDDLFIAKMISATDKFMNININMHIPPKVSVAIDKEFILEAIEKDIESKDVTDDVSMNSDIAEYKRLEHDIKNLTRDRDAIKEIIVNKYLDGRRPTLPTCSVKITSYTSKRFDSERFKKDCPEIYKQYLKETTVLKTNIK